MAGYIEGTQRACIPLPRRNVPLNSWRVGYTTWIYIYHVDLYHGIYHDQKLITCVKKHVKKSKDPAHEQRAAATSFRMPWCLCVCG